MESNSLIFQSIIFIVLITIWIYIQYKIDLHFTSKRHKIWINTIEKILTFKSSTNNSTNNQSK